MVDVFPALETGNLTLLTEAMAREVTTDGNGRATGVIYVDKKARTERRIEARVVALAASTCESIRILLNSKTKEFPNGVANSSGLVGRYLMDTVGFGVSGYVPALENVPRYDTDGFGGAHIYGPWWLWEDHHKLGFPRGYHIEVGGGFRMPGIGSFQGVARDMGYGRKLKQRIREEYGASVSFAGRGEMIPNNLSYCEIDPEVVDRWGIPVLRFQFRFADYEWKQARHMEKTFTGLIEEMGGRVTRLGHPRFEQSGISIPGTIIHEVGGARMGDNPRDSVVDRFCRAHDVPNLYLCDGAPFTRGAAGGGGETDRDRGDLMDAPAAPLNRLRAQDLRRIHRTMRDGTRGRTQRRPSAASTRPTSDGVSSTSTPAASSALRFDA